MGWCIIMVNIDYILELFDWENSTEEQERGVVLARDIRCTSVFLQPGIPYGKRVWDNCARALAERDDEILRPYLIPLLEWIQDMNWPGAYCILRRLQQFKDFNSLSIYVDICKEKAKLLGDDIWEDNLNVLM